MHQQLSDGCPAAIAQRFGCPHRGQTDAAGTSVALLALGEGEVMADSACRRVARHGGGRAEGQCTAQAHTPLRSGTG